MMPFAMLTHLSIKNLAVVDSISIEIAPGMTVITGETGVGKSLVVDGLALLMGQRAESHLVGQASNKAELCGIFSLDHAPRARAWLGEHGVESSDSEVVIRRVINTEGPSRAFINGTPMTLSELKSFSQSLLDIHAQHEHQALLKRDSQRHLLDEFAAATPQAAKVAVLFEAWSALQARQAELLASKKDRADRIGFLDYQLDELAKLDLQPGEVNALDTELLQLANADENLSFAQQAQRLINDDDRGGGLAALQTARLALGKIKDPNLTAMRDQLEQSLLQIDELNRDLLRYLDVSQANPERLQWVEHRMQQIHDISRKHRCPPEQLITLQATLSDELTQLSDSDAAVETLSDDIQTAKNNWDAAATHLSKKRAKGKLKIEKTVKNLLTQMGMGNACLEVSLAPYNQPSRFGLEETTFLIATNPGQTPQPLNKIASGGELSRISLAIQVATLGTSAVGTIIFDEVDVGIGGGVAQTVGALLRTLSAQAQVLCVTHLGQVAAQGHNHFKVTKDINATAIEPLSASGRVEEIARMLSGIEITEKSLAHAREMMMTAQSR
tara:strand:+ start:4146 stop:5816 length:1671 start_codon:yes stop_codon:yes gene_type:complete